MMTGDPPACRPVEGSFHGLPTVGLAGEGAWFEALAGAGPRIVRLGLTGGPNLLAETPDLTWPTRQGPYRPFGGHRLWLAPEASGRHAAPDDAGLALTPLRDGLRLTGAPDPETGCIRSIEIHLDARRPVLRVLHEVRNAGPRPVEAALWAITQLPPGGVAILPQPTAAPGHGTQPNRLVALWPYASWDDPRLIARDGLLAVRGDAGPDFKIGCADHLGWVAWARDGVAVVRRWEPEPGGRYPDLGCSSEVFATRDYTELEVLGPIVGLAEGACATLAETWELRAAATGEPAELRDSLAQPINSPPA
jgi:hypothetical protein